MINVLHFSVSCKFGDHVRSPLQFSENRPLTLKKDHFGSREYQLLNLCSFNIELIEASTFTGMNHLEYLDLSDNALVKISGILLKPLVNLKSLDLSGNYIEILEVTSFQNFRKLTEVYFQGTLVLNY
jgi:Leucine-rich repeat (LRR) protein